VVLAVLATSLVTSQQVLGVAAVAAAHLVGRRLHGLPTTYVLVCHTGALFIGCCRVCTAAPTMAATAPFSWCWAHQLN
jgi:hypothetical protein